MTTENTTASRGNNSVRVRTTPVMPRALRLLLGALAFAALSGPAMARDNVSFSISIGTPMPMYAPPPVYVTSPPVYVTAPPVHVGYGHVYAPPPRVVYYATPYPAPRWHKRDHGRHGRGHGHGRGGEHRHGWR